MKARYLMAALVSAVVMVVIAGRSEPEPLDAKQYQAQVAYVIDGDTLILAGNQPRIRLWGVDAAEADEAGFQMARDALMGLVQGKQISYTVMDYDRYGRLVARVFLPDGLEVNRLLIEQGRAREYCKYSQGFYGHCT